MNYPETLSYLYERLPMFTRIGSAAFKKDLTNTLRLCEALGNPQKKFPCLHVAGTNGKGSTSSMLAAILTAAGYRTGLYTSPHLRSFTERIRIQGEEISEAAVVGFVEKNRELIEEVQPSFFETTVAMAFDYFAQEEVDIAVIEVGLGGRLDSTNVITPILSVITNISWDHSDLLGDTLEKIASEKAGIIKPGVPVVVSERQSEVDSVFIEMASQSQSDLLFASDRLSASLLSRDYDGQKILVSRKGSQEGVDPYEVDLPGSYQLKNLLGVLCAVELLQKQGFTLSELSVRTGLAQVKRLAGLKGRMQRIGQNPDVFCDTGHNEAGIREVVAQMLERAGGDPSRVFWVWGMVNDKDHGKVLKLLPKESSYFWVCPDIPRGLRVGEMAEKGKIFGLTGNTYSSVQQGLMAGIEAARTVTNGLVFVGGSTFVVAEIIPE